jgi:hypothetical protein
MHLELELALFPVRGVDRAKTFYAEKAGFNLAVDTSCALQERRSKPRR